MQISALEVGRYRVNLMSITEPTAAAVSHFRDSPLSEVSDADLLEAWTEDGCREALSAIIERYSMLVLSVCRRCCRSSADADDAFQATFLYLVRSASKIRHPEHLPGWLHRVAQRASFATLATQGPHFEAVADFPDEPVDPLDRLTQRHAAIVLDEELASLPEHYRTAIVQHVLLNESYLTLAAQMGTSVGTVRGRVQRGKQLLAQRLRHRGVVPVIAYSAAIHWSVTPTEAGQTATALVADVAFPSQLPSPIELSSLQPLLSQGSSVMTKSLVASAGVFGLTVAAFLLHDLIPIAPTTRAEGTVLAQTSPLPTPPGADFSAAEDPFGLSPANSGTQASPPVAPLPPADDPFAELPSSTPPGPARSGTGRPAHLAIEPADADERRTLAYEALGRRIGLPQSVPLAELGVAIEQFVGVPTRVETRAIEFAKIPDGATIRFEQSQRSVRTALREALRPWGLRAIVDQEGAIVITADPTLLVHRGVGVSRWITIDDDAERAIAEKLAAKVAHSFVNETLENALRIVAEGQQLPIQLDRLALEDAPRSLESPVNLTAQDVTLRTLLDLMLHDLDLTYTVRGEVLVVTTFYVADYYPLTRIYWLEGTGLTGASGHQAIETITLTLEPEAWENAGGISKIKIAAGGAESRPAIIVTAPYTLHFQIENLISAMRQTHFGPDEPFDRSEPPAVPTGGMGMM